MHFSIIVMQFIYDCGRMKMDRGLWARMHPAEAERLVEIMPRKHGTRSEGFRRAAGNLTV